MSIFRPKSTSNWILPVSVMGLCLGVLLQYTLVTQDVRNSRKVALDADQQVRLRDGWPDLQAEVLRLSTSVEQLRRENTKLQNSMSSTTSTTKVLNDSLQAAKEFAGLTSVEGPGIVITLQDAAEAASLGNSAAQKTIHDIDVLKVVNELWASGAQAISVNGHRVIGRTSFRCVGPVIHIDFVPIASPIHVRAIGSPDTLRGGLTLPGGILDEIRATGDPSMVSIETVAKQAIPPYTGPTEPQGAKK